jgi:(1->4)-alpha-D-glucan 1-alpha-D-glucosylmutase
MMSSETAGPLPPGGPRSSSSNLPVPAPRIPAATYRVQFNASFTFRDATALVPYLHHLGISDLYASPILTARSTSTHGYDICDPTQINPTLGTPEDFDALVTALREHRMGLLLDTVPNHMGIGETCNAWWMDVLENGPGSVYARFFDIDWHPAKPELANRILLPILEDQYGIVLEAGKLQLRYRDGAFYIAYYESRLPVSPQTYPMILEPCLERLRELIREDEALPADGPATTAALPASEPVPALPSNEYVLEMQSILTALSHLPPRTETDSAHITERMRETEVIKRRLAALYHASPEMQVAVQNILQVFNQASPGDPHSVDLLDRLLESQVHRVAYWRVAGEEINYRRFFDINDLAAVRVELPEVFQATHQLTLRLLQNDQVTGLRIDHPDGLWDPTTYFRRLQDSYIAARQEQEPAQAAEAAGAEGSGGPISVGLGLADHQPLVAGELPLYIVAEKILTEREPLPEEWAVYGTTGYDFLASVNNLFVQRANGPAFDRIYSQFVGRQIDLPNLVLASKLSIMRDYLASEINSLSHEFERIGERNRHYRDFTLNGITSALREVIACLPVYRTYINPVTGDVPERDRKFVEMSIRAARRRRPGLARAIFDFIRDTLLLRNMKDFDEADRPALAKFVMRFQQLSGPVMAKGAEDTAFYIYNRLVSLNEVGCNPDQFGIALADFHRSNSRRAQRWPHSMLATSTHDSKRSEDVRARIDVLSEIPDAWRTALARWGRLNKSKKVMLDGAQAPDRNDECLLYQTLIGAWPLAQAYFDGHGHEDGEIHRPSPEIPASQPSDRAASRRRNGSHKAPAYGESTGLHVGGVGAARADDPVRGDSERTENTGLHSWPALLLQPEDEEFRQFRERIQAYMQKASREAKVHTSWINPDPDYDAALQAFVEHLLLPSRNNIFLREAGALAAHVAYYGQFNSLSQLLLKFTAPGVPDIYQGNEVWDFSLVDPDNRRPVDYERRRAQLEALSEQIRQAEEDGGKEALPELAEEILAHAQDGRIKLYVTQRTLDYRQEHHALFRDGAYLPLEVTGSKGDCACVFARRVGAEQVLIVAPRLVVGLTNDIRRPPMGREAWADSWLPLPEEPPGSTYRNLFTAEMLRVGDRDGRPGLPLASVLGHFPVALLERTA